MIAGLGTKELLMLYAFLLQSSHLASHPEGKDLKLVLGDRILINRKVERKDGKVSRKVVLKTEDRGESLSLPFLFFLQKEVEDRLFSLTSPEPVTWGTGSDYVSVEPEEGAVALKVVDRGSPFRVRFSSFEVLRELSASIETIRTWNAPYPVSTPKVEVFPGRTAFAVLRLLGDEKREIELGVYPVLNLALYSFLTVRSLLTVS